ncbi:glycosyltransferase family 4 protein [Rhizobacter fulvus]
MSAVVHQRVLRIVLVTHYYPAHGGGIERVAAQLAASMAKSGAEVVWCASDTDPPPALPGVSCAPMTTFNAMERISGLPYPLWSPRSLMRLARRVRDADAVHVHDAIYAGSLAGAWLARRYRKRLIVTQHIGPVPLPALLRPLLVLANRTGARYVLHPADAVAFISPAVRRYFETLTRPSPRFHDVPNGVDGGVFRPSEGDPAEIRSRLGFDPSRPLMLFVGRFVPKKRLPLLREMAAARPDWQWCVIGHGPEQPERWGLPQVRVLPAMDQSNLVAYYQAADLLVLPSHGEGFPLVVQEAMACGLPACITESVAAGSAVPPSLRVILPEAGIETSHRAVAAVAGWLALPDAQRDQQRHDCAAFAAAYWNWDAAVHWHLQQLAESRRE